MSSTSIIKVGNSKGVSVMGQFYAFGTEQQRFFPVGHIQPQEDSQRGVFREKFRAVHSQGNTHIAGSLADAGRQYIHIDMVRVVPVLVFFIQAGETGLCFFYVGCRVFLCLNP